MVFFFISRRKKGRPLEIFKIIGTVALDGVEQFNKDVDSASEHGSKFATALGNGLKTLATVGATTLTATTAAVGALTKMAMSNYADYEQLVGGVETLFKDSGGQVMQYANNAFRTAGLSANEYMETVTSFSASLLQGLGGDTEQAAEIANLAITDMSDNANKMGTDMSLIQNAYQGFAKQNYTMLDNLKLGYGGTATEMARLINDSGVLGDTIEVTADTVNTVSFDKIIQAINTVQTRMGITGTTAKEASTTIQGSVASMKGAWTNFLTGLSDDTADMEALITNLSETVITVSENVVPVLLGTLPNIASSLVTLADTLLSEHVPGIVQDLISGLMSSVPQLATTVFEVGTQILASLIQGIQQNASSLSQAAVDIAVGFVQFVLENLPTIISAGAEILVNLATGIADAIPELASTAVATITQIVETLTDPETLEALLEAAVEIITALGIAITENLPLLVDAAINLMTRLVEFLTTEENLALLVNTAITFITKISTALIENLPLLVGAALEVVTKLATELTKQENLLLIAEAGLQLFLGIVGKLPEIVNQLCASAGVMISQLVMDLTGADKIAEFFGVGEKWGKALAEGFASTIGAVLTGGAINIKGSASAIAEKAKQASNQNIPIPKMAKGGVLGKGQLGFLEGDGAEAVVPLDQNRAWISAVAADMNAAGIGGQPTDTQALKEIFQDFLGAFPDMMEEAFSKMKFDVNNREFARLVKAVN